MSRQRPEQRPAQQREDEFKIYRPNEDRFAIPAEEIPDGMTYEWKRLTMLGKEDHRHQANLARNRWTPVPAERHPLIGGDPTPDDDRGNAHPHRGCIIVDGMILMERPAHITDIVVADAHRQAKGQVRDQFHRLKLVPDGTMSDDRTRARSVSVKRERDLSIPEDAEIG